MMRLFEDGARAAFIKINAISLLSFASFSTTSQAKDMILFEDFKMQPESRWTYVADGVMGGVSQGQADVVVEGDTRFMRLTGSVSTENNGGFVQVRHRLSESLPPKTRALRLIARGNGEAYYVFLRTTGLSRVWHSYRYMIEPGAQWSEFELPLSAFKPSHNGMVETFEAKDVTSIGLVAYGRDHEAQFDIQRIELLD